jgi:hypothetical protein
MLFVSASISIFTIICSAEEICGILIVWQNGRIVHMELFLLTRKIKVEIICDLFMYSLHHQKNKQYNRVYISLGHMKFHWVFYSLTKTSLPGRIKVERKRAYLLIIWSQSLPWAIWQKYITNESSKG